MSLSCCGAEDDVTQARHYCARPLQARYERPSVAMRPTGERLEPWRCRCHKLKVKQHTMPHQCLSDSDLLPFLAAHPEVNAYSPRVKMWAYMFYEFSS